jgi:hypothetical protein
MDIVQRQLLQILLENSNVKHSDNLTASSDPEKKFEIKIFGIGNISRTKETCTPLNISGSF